jgi:hypothetical protein
MEQVSHLEEYHILGNAELQYVYREHKNQPISAVQRHSSHSCYKEKKHTELHHSVCIARWARH